MQDLDIVFVDVPAFEADPSPINLKNVAFFRKALADRWKFSLEPSITLKEAVQRVVDRGFTCLGRAELMYLLKQEISLGRRLDCILKARPFQMPIILFPADDQNEPFYPALTSTPGWTKIGVKTTLPLCSNRFLLPVYTTARSDT